MIIGSLAGIGTVGQFASIKVTANPGSTVTCTTPKGIILTATEVSGTWLFDRLNTYGNYIINCPPYGETVKVDSAMLYDVGLSYESLNYLESSGTQYINTGIVLNSGTSSFEIKTEQESDAAGQSIFGTNNIYTVTSQTANHNYAYRCGSNTIYPMSNFVVEDMITIIGTPTSITFTTSSKTETAQFTATSTSLAFDSILFGRTSTDGNPEELSGTKRVYYCKIWNGSALVRYFIPVKRTSDSVLGMFDIVSNTFFTNAGTGTFIGG